MTSGQDAALIALDWGTSSLRAWLLAEGGTVIASRSADWGIMHLPEGGFAGALDGLCGDWLAAHPSLAVIASGMVGSAQGWLEVPYVPAPASAQALAQGIGHVDGPRGTQVAIVPGVLQDGRRPNVMRGEETQVIGALALAPELFGANGDGLVVLPGTHSKWVQVRQGRIDAFLTFMTGEVYEVLRKHSILGRLMPGDSVPAPQAYALGIAEAADEDAGNLLSSLFTVRTLGLTRRLQPAQLADYLSGLLIGHEIREARSLFAQQTCTGAPLALVGAEDLCRRYAQALPHFGLAVSGTQVGNAAPAGLWKIACLAGLVAKGHALC